VRRSLWVSLSPITETQGERGWEVPGDQPIDKPRERGRQDQGLSGLRKKCAKGRRVRDTKVLSACKRRLAYCLVDRE
jgi:hypothetical protein